MPSTEPVRQAALGMLRASLSAKGLQLTLAIMRLNHTLGELNHNNFERYGEWLYGITVMGTLSAKEPWGWQLDGHHAIIHVSKAGNINMAQAFQDNLVIEYVGIRASELAAEQQMQLLALIDEYVRNMDDGHATVKMAEVLRHFDHTHFAWIGGTESTSVFYYRIQSLVMLIEFDHQLPVGLRHLASDPQVVDREHIHSCEFLSANYTLSQLS